MLLDKGSAFAVFSGRTLCEKLLTMKTNKISIVFLSFSISLLGCKKTNNEESTTFHASFQAMIDSTSINITETNNYRQGYFFSYYEHINGSDSLGVYVGSSLYKWNFNPDTIIQTSVYINFSNHIPNDNVYDSTNTLHISELLFRQLFHLGDYTYTFLPWIKKGIVIIWYDNKGVQWQSGRNSSYSNFYPISQPDYSRNQFTIINSKPVSAPYSHFYEQDVVLTFNCWVYNKYGDSVQIKNAKYSGICLY